MEELLHEFLVKTDCYSDLMEAPGDAATQSKTTEMWVENLVKPVFIMMLFVRAERKLAIAPVGCQRDAALLLCGKSHQLCQIWALLHAVHGKAPQRDTHSLLERSMYCATSLVYGMQSGATCTLSQHSCIMVMGQIALLVSLCSHQHSNDGPSACTHVVSLCRMWLI